MQQLTLRIDDELARRLKVVAADRGDSVNAFASAVLQAAVDPDLAGDEAQRVRERLARAGLLASVEAGDRERPPRDAVNAARARAGSGRPLSELVTEGRA